MLDDTRHCEDCHTQKEIGPRQRRFAMGEPRCTIALMSPISVRGAWVFAFCASALGAQQQGPSLAQLDHKAWTIRDGAPPNVTALAQSADGVLWVGTLSGLYRFDGVRFEEFEP